MSTPAQRDWNQSPASMPDTGAEPLYQRQPDTETKETFYGVPFTWRWPEQVLIAAIIEDAEKCLKDPADLRKRRDQNEARDWFLDKHSHYICSFSECCDWLGINKNYVLKKLRVKYPRVFR